MPAAKPRKKPAYVVRNSPIHGRGVFAGRTIRKGTQIVEYRGERISMREAERRPDSDPDNPYHTFLFELNDGQVIDAAVRGNAARWINHSCAPNCETLIENGRVFIEAIRAIEPGEELGYDYQLTWESKDDPAELALFDCHCGAAECRGSMLDPVPLDKKRALKRKAAARKRKSAASGKRASRPRRA